MSHEILKLQETHYSKRENITLFRFFFPLELFSAGPPRKIMAEE